MPYTNQMTESNNGQKEMKKVEGKLNKMQIVEIEN